MEKKSVTCPVCGGSEYYNECGFYFCSECQTQSQELAEHVHENDGGGAKIVIKKPTTNTERVESDEWTTWEFYNFILKGLVDELIGLGAKKRIKIVVLQLWATYLKKLEVAFTSQIQTRLPRLGINYHPRDAKLVYNFDVEERNRSRRKRKACKRRILESSAAASSLTSKLSNRYLDKLQLSRSKRALYENDYGKHVESSKDAVSEFDENMRSFETSSGGLLTSASESNFRSPRLMFSNEARKLRSEFRSGGSSCSSKSSRHKKLGSCNVLPSSNPRTLSRIKLLAILHIALRILQDNIQLSDILRWVEEGELSFYEVMHFFPDDVKLKGHDLVTFGPSSKRPSYYGVNKTAKELALYLQVTQVPAIDLLYLARRYIEELQLPAEIGKYVECIVALSPPSAEFNHFGNSEGRAMAYIIFVLKLLLGLDGKTEYEISKVTKKLSELSVGEKRLFVWEEWVQYIECRKSALARFHFPTQTSHYRDTLNSASSYLKFWKRMKSKDDNRHERVNFSKVSKMNSDFVSSMKNVFLKLAQATPDDDASIDFIPSLTPQKSNLEAVFESRPSAFQSSTTEIPSCADILNQDFTSTTLQHLLKPEKYVGIARKKGVKIIVEEKSAQHQVKLTDKIKKKFPFSGDRTYLIVDTAKEVPSNKNAKNRKTELNPELSSKKRKGYSVTVPGTASSKDKLFCSSKTFGDLPAVAENMLVKHLKSNGIASNCKSFKYNGGDVNNSTASNSNDENSDPSRSTRNDSLLQRSKTENNNHNKMNKKLPSNKFRTAISHVNNSTASTSSHSRSSENDKLLQHSEKFSNLPLIAEKMLERHLGQTSISSKLQLENDKLLQHSERFSNLPVIAEKMLESHLGQRSISSKLDYRLFRHSKGPRLPLAANVLTKHIKKKSSQRSGQSKNEFVLYLPYTEYWLNEFNSKLWSCEDFEREVAIDFPSSFLWLLTECSRLLQMTTQALYYELLDVEVMYCFGPQSESPTKVMK